MSVEREIVMTIYRIEADLINVSSPGREAFAPGFIRVSAQGGGEFHTWAIERGQHCWIGDRVTVTIIEDDPAAVDDEFPVTPPPIDKRSG